jgi:putative two-component system response regulator
MEDKILIVDDSLTDCMIIDNMLDDYDTITAINGEEAIERLKSNPDIDLMILDLNMPVMDGFEVLSILKNNPGFHKVRTIILTNFDEIENEIRGLKMGAVDFIRKPINIDALRLRIDIQMKLKQNQNQIEKDNERLDSMVKKRTDELMVTRDITIQALVGLLEVRNLESHNHTLRTQKIMKLLCDNLKSNSKYDDILTEKYIEELVDTTPLHDIGKVGIPDEILLKPGRLTNKEYDLMKKHVDYGVKALQDELHDDKVVPSFIKTALEIIATHHERFDGKGYPYGLSGKNIPLPGRLMAIIDVYDALMSERVYKKAYDREYTINYIKKERGRQFDPDIVDVFLTIQDDIVKITKNYQ